MEQKPLAIRPKAFFDAIGVRPTKGWEIIAAGEVESFKIGNATLITTASTEAYVQRQLAKAKAERRQPVAA